MNNKSILLLSFITSLFIVSSISVYEITFSVIFFYAIFFFLGFYYIRVFTINDLDKGRFFTILFVYGYIFKVFLAILTYYYFISINGYPFEGTSDSMSYHLSAISIAETWLGKGSHGIIMTGSNLFNHLGGVLYFIGELVGGANPLNVRFFNCLISALIPIFIFEIGSIIYNKKIGRIAAIIAFWFPDFMLYASLQLRDIILAFLFLLIAYSFITFIQKRKNISLFYAILLIFILFAFRPAYAVIVAGIFFMGMMITLLQQKKYFKILVISLILLFVLIPKIKDSDLIRLIITTSQDYNIVTYITESNTAIVKAASSDSLGSSLVASSTSIRKRFTILHIMEEIIPYPPWKDILSPTTPLTVQEDIAGIFWHLILPLCILGFIYSLKHNRSESFFLWSSTLLIIFIVGITYPSLRFRLPVMPFCVIFASVGITIYRRRDWFLAFYIGFQFLLFFAYHFLKYRFAFPSDVFKVWLIISMSYIVFTFQKEKLNRIYSSVRRQLNNINISGRR